MKQTRIESIVETCLNVGSGFLIAALFMQFVIVPVFDLPTHAGENLTITLLFTAISIARGYCWRRLFANEVHKLVARAIRGKGRVRT